MTITLEAAIKILELTPEYTEDGEPIGELDARRLGIEALNRIQRQRQDLMASEIKLLPGETKE